MLRSDSRLVLYETYSMLKSNIVVFIIGNILLSFLSYYILQDIRSVLLLLLIYNNFHYFVIFQYENSKIIISDQMITITYPFSFYLKTRKYSFKEILEVVFNYDPGGLITPQFKIYFKNKKRRKKVYLNVRKMEEFAKVLEKVKCPYRFINRRKKYLN